jgi:hypothetical protein
MSKRDKSCAQHGEVAVLRAQVDSLGGALSDAASSGTCGICARPRGRCKCMKTQVCEPPLAPKCWECPYCEGTGIHRCNEAGCHQEGEECIACDGRGGTAESRGAP